MGTRRALSRALRCSVTILKLINMSLGGALLFVAAGVLEAAPKPRPRPNVSACGDSLGYQVLLDRRGFSPGEIDGRRGANLQRALAAFQKANNLPDSGQVNCETWKALSAESAPVMTDYKITEADAKGPFVNPLPRDLIEQSQLPALSYQSITEALAERFHASPALLTRLNPGKRFAPGTSITVPAVTPFVDGAKPAGAAPLEGLTIEVSREGTLRAVRPDGRVEFFAPVTSGSEHDPLPPGQWKVTAVSWRPTFHYNPALFWDANPEHSKAAIKPGPNNPVGVVWIDLNLEHYGLHGTPEPSHVGHTQSHGCVRLTNWDAARVAGMVKVGTPVIFQ